MLNLIRKLVLVFTYGDELIELLKKNKADKERDLFEARRNHLKLCLKHQQEQNRSHYAEHNCDHCKLLNLVNQEQAP